MADDASRPVLIASWNGGPATLRAVELARSGTPMLDAIVEGVSLVEDDPEEVSVGFGGLPNEDGVVELDAAVMDGPAHRAGAVAALRGVRHAARVALEVMRRTDHSLLVGEGALKFARLLGFKEEDLVTPRAREAYLTWKSELSERDAWVSRKDSASEFGVARWAGRAGGGSPEGVPGPGRAGQASAPATAPHTYGTIHVSGVDAAGDLWSVTSTSGLSYKLAGRAGDSPIVGAGLYTDNAVGSAGATGRGEAVMQVCGAHAVVTAMENGLSPEEACLHVLKRIADRTREKRLLDEKGRPRFNVTLYALRKDGVTGCASMHEGYEHIEQRAGDCRVMANACLFSTRS